MSERPHLATVGELLDLLQGCPRDIPVLIQIEPEEFGQDPVASFVVQPQVTGKTITTYRGELSVVRLSLKQDQP